MVLDKGKYTSSCHLWSNQSDSFWKTPFACVSQWWREKLTHADDFSGFKEHFIAIIEELRNEWWTIGELKSRFIYLWHFLGIGRRWDLLWHLPIHLDCSPASSLTLSALKSMFWQLHVTISHPLRRSPLLSHLFFSLPWQTGRLSWCYNKAVLSQTSRGVSF